MEVKTERNKVTLPILITEKENTRPLLARQDLQDKLMIDLQGNRETNAMRIITANGRGEKLFEEFENFYRKNHTIKDLTIDIQLNKHAKSIQHKGRPVPIHFQKIVNYELEKLIEKEHEEKADKTTETVSYHRQ